MTSPIGMSDIVGVVLAGGLSRRMEGPEKSLLPLSDKPLISQVCDRLKPQVSKLIINANGAPARFEFLGYPVQSDTVEGFAGPLAGILAGMRWCQNHTPDKSHIVSSAADTPFFPADMVESFLTELGSQAAAHSKPAICLAYSDGNRHPVFGLWPINLADALEGFLVDEDMRKVMLFAQRYNLIKVDFPLQAIQSSEANNAKYDPFFNINTPDDFMLAENLIEKLSE